MFSMHHMPLWLGGLNKANQIALRHQQPFEAIVDTSPLISFKALTRLSSKRDLIDVASSVPLLIRPFVTQRFLFDSRSDISRRGYNKTQ